MECKVCKSPKATTHNYYGATSVCQSCRGFFMRSVQSELYKVFCQVHGKTCEINSKNRKSCKKCRFEKCLQVGMKTSYVKSIEERCRQILLSQKVEKSKMTDFFIESPALIERSDKSTNDYVKIVFDFYEQRQHLFIKHFCTSKTNIASDQDINEWSKTDIYFFEKIINFQAKLDGIQEDSKVLCNHNMAKLNTLMYMLIFADKIGQTYYDQMIEYGNQNRQVNANVNELMILHDQYGSPNPKVHYETMFSSPWAANIDIEMEHENIYKEITKWAGKLVDESKELDHVLVLLLQLILLYNSDGIESQLRNLQAVQNLQNCYAKLLHKYLRSKHEYHTANSLFSKGLMLVHDTQRAFELSLQRLRLE